MALVLSGVTASAQSASDVAGNIDPLFQGLLAQPASFDNTLKYGVSATQAGDIESAIGTFEQLLFYNPTLSRVRFELGVLYYRLGSYDMARGYFQSALEMKDISADMRQKADEFLAVIDKKLQPDQFSGFAQAGLRYQTNASAGAGPQPALASGLTFDKRFFAQSDWNGFGAFGLNYSHDFGNQRGDTFEATILGYDAQQFTLHQFDIGLMELRAGPRFAISADGANGATLKPYAIATGAVLADAPYYGGVGGGVTMHANVGNVALDPYVEIVQQSFRNSSFYPLASGLSGTQSTYALAANGPIFAGLDWQSRVAFAHANDVFDPYSYNRYSADVWLPWKFTMAGDSRAWTLTPTAGVSRWLYKAPDPAIDPTTTQHSLEWRVGLGLDVPIWQQFTLGLLVEYRTVSSNVAVFSMHDLAVTAGPALKF
ncbi:MAG TPA: hypothetical protein VHX39_01070 [Acetobacteraceae bacterium]|jgi:hypothetical protein|nr:hypothetical protein [Acetobacteraceae bacterium]